MQKFLSKYGTAAHLALLAVAPLFLTPFCSPDVVATVLLWLSLPTAFWVFLEPSRRKSQNEMLHDARARVASAVWRDPVVWILVGILAYTAIRWANDGIRLAYDSENVKWMIRPQTLQFLPGSVKGTGFYPFVTVLASTVLFIGCRHSLGKKARFSFLFSCAAFATLAGLISVVAFLCQHKGVIALTRCSATTASYPGATYGLYFLGGLVAILGAFMSQWRRLILIIAFAACGTLTGLYFFAPTPVVMLYLAASLVMLALICGFAGFTMSGSIPFKFLAIFMIAMTVPILSIVGFASQDLNAARLSFMNDGGALFEPSFLEMRAALTRMASQVWGEKPWLGTGLGSFIFDIRFQATADDWAILLPYQKVALNGWWYLLAERGIVGALSIALVIGGFLFVFIQRLWSGFSRRLFLPLAFLGPFALIVLSVEALMDVSFLRADVLMACAAFLALACSSLPDPIKADEEEAHE